MKSQRFIREKQPVRRIVTLSLFASTVFFLLFTRLWYLQILKTESFRDLSENNRLRFLPVAASRGGILDRNGKELVKNRPSFSVAVIQKDVQDKDALLDRLARILKVERKELEERWEKGKGRAKYYPIVLASGISREQLEVLEENNLSLPGVNIEMKPVRDYTNGILAAHLLGPIGEVTEADLDSDAFQEYNPGDYVGKSGIERSWEQDLHGADGGRQIEVDALGRVLRNIRESRPVDGNTLILTIDQELQKTAEQAFGDQAGAAVAMDVNSGEILAFVSNPGFDPALFSGRMTPQQWDSYLNDRRHPLENKALKGQYPPGSTFKIVTALAALEEGVIDEQSSVVCTGSYTMGTKKFGCWDKKGHGRVTLRRALKESCDVYFYQLGERLGVDRIAAYARKLGLGTPMGVGLESEKGGLIPTIAWKEKKFKKKWYSGETLPVAIGQGYVLMTPVQLASMIATVANEGTVYRPHLVKKVMDQDGKLLKEFLPEIIGTTGIKPASYELVKEGLAAVVNERGGTGGLARLYEVKVAGKTGTSQVVKLPDSKGYVPYQFRDHALFVAFAPYDKPEIAVAVVIEHGMHGGGSAAPIAGRILKAYFEGKGQSVRQAVREPKPPADPAGQLPTPPGEPPKPESEAILAD